MARPTRQEEARRPRSNPFHPTFGVNPPYLAGRDDLLEIFEEALANEPGEPGRATLYTGARGTGKTVMLNAVEDVARHSRWAVVSETATPGMTQRLTNDLIPGVLERYEPGAARRLTSITAPVVGGGVTWDTSERHHVVPGLRTQIIEAARLAAGDGGGLLITVDELQRASRNEIEALSVAVQHAFREGEEVAFVGAGLPAAVSDLLSDDGVVTFLRRADRYGLGTIGASDVERALVVPITERGRAIGPQELAAAVEATGGYPFMVQLVGYHTWRQHPDQPAITADDVQRGVAAAQRRLGTTVHEPSLTGLSDVDRTFLVAMAQDDGPSQMADVADRMSVDANYAGQYRLRLIEAGLVQSAGRGRVDFALPYLREFLRSHPAAQWHPH